MARFNVATIKALQKNLPKEGNIYNPVDVLGDAKAERFQFALEKVLQDDNVDIVIVLLCPTAVTEPEETAKAIVKLNKKYTQKAIFAAYMGGKKIEKGSEILSEGGVPCFTFPEPIVSCIKGMVTYSQAREGKLPMETLAFGPNCLSLDIPIINSIPLGIIFWTSTP
ncbi:MAG: hypothetical protein ACOYBM_07830 [Dethiobacteria bacterium]|jgi:acyl-CoA synthetase (NDP forming)